ncbi:MAG: hypothetical protein SGARI_008222 [Bacillariaceae sp.]
MENNSDNDGGFSMERDPSHEMDNLPASHPAMIAVMAGKRNRGWQGEALELQHSVDCDNGSNKTTISTAAAVGKGYQAKHVVRQKTAGYGSSDRKKTKKTSKTTATTLDMDGGAAKRHFEDNLKKKEDLSKANEKKSTRNISKQDLLQNKGLRNFRKEIESILSS